MIFSRTGSSPSGLVVASLLAVAFAVPGEAKANEAPKAGVAVAALESNGSVQNTSFEAPSPEAAPPPPTTGTKPSPYSLPWQLRPVAAVRAVRSDSTFAAYENSAGSEGLSFASLLTFVYGIDLGGGPGTGLTPMLRLALAGDAPQTPGIAGTAIANPLVGAGYAFKVGQDFRFNAFFGTTLPVGAGGGDAPSAEVLNARLKASNARAQMDGAIFAVNDVSLIPGFDVAYVKGGLTVQAEVTVAQLIRVRGAAAQPEASKTNFLSGLHVGYFPIPALSLGAEVRYQRWLVGPRNLANDPTGATRDNLTLALGPRFHMKLGSWWFRPGVAYQRGLDKPLAASTPNYHLVQVDLPVVF